MRRQLTVITAAVTAALVLAACGGAPSGTDTTEAGGGGADGLTPVSVHVMPIVDTAPFYLALDRGIFEDHGLDVTFEATLQGGAVTIPAVTSGTSDFGFSNSPALITAYANGLDLPIVANASTSNGDAQNDTAGVVVAAHSDITSIADLSGRRVAVNTLNSIQDTTIRAAVDAEGGEAETIKFTELPFPDQLGAIADGEVDAGYLAEPFVTIAERAGLRYLGSPHAVLAPAQNISVYFTSRKYAEDNPAIVQAFADSISEAQAFATEHPDAAIEILSTYMELAPEVQEAITLPGFPAELTEKEIQFQIDLLAEQGVIDRSISASDMSLAP